MSNHQKPQTVSVKLFHSPTDCFEYFNVPAGYERWLAHRQLCHMHEKDFIKSVKVVMTINGMVGEFLDAQYTDKDTIEVSFLAPVITDDQAQKAAQFSENNENFHLQKVSVLGNGEYIRISKKSDGSFVAGMRMFDFSKIDVSPISEVYDILILDNESLDRGHYWRSVSKGFSDETDFLGLAKEIFGYMPKP